jgi:hypothetical protein
MQKEVSTRYICTVKHVKEVHEKLSKKYKNSFDYKYLTSAFWISIPRFI